MVNRFLGKLYHSWYVKIYYESYLNIMAYLNICEDAVQPKVPSYLNIQKHELQPQEKFSCNNKNNLLTVTALQEKRDVG